MKSGRLNTGNLKKKIDDSISRLFFTLLLRVMENESNYLNWAVEYRYILCFNEIKRLSGTHIQIEDAIQSPGKSVLFQADTILGKKPVVFKAFQEETETCVIQWEDLP
jgi:hypothetical protein